MAKESKSGAETPLKTDGRPKGRDDGAGNGAPKAVGGGVTVTQHTCRQGSVVIRATVEHTGVVGDTEMTVHVRWPASSFCAPCCEETSSSEGQDSDAPALLSNGPGAYILKANAPTDSSFAEVVKAKAESSSTNTDYPDPGQ